MKYNYIITLKWEAMLKLEIDFLFWISYKRLIWLTKIVSFSSRWMIYLVLQRWWKSSMAIQAPTLQQIHQWYDTLFPTLHNASADGHPAFIECGYPTSLAGVLSIEFTPVRLRWLVLNFQFINHTLLPGQLRCKRAAYILHSSRIHQLLQGKLRST